MCHLRCCLKQDIEYSFTKQRYSYYYDYRTGNPIDPKDGSHLEVLSEPEQEDEDLPDDDLPFDDLPQPEEAVAEPVAEPEDVAEPVMEPEVEPEPSVEPEPEDDKDDDSAISEDDFNEIIKMLNMNKNGQKRN